MMKNFRLMKSDVDTMPLLEEIASVPDAWNLNTGRQDKIKVQREAQAIGIRGLVKSKIDGRDRRDVHESRWTTISKQFPRFRAYLEAFAEERDAELSRGKIVRLMPGRRVYPHIDRGEYYEARDRFHLVLKSPAGSYLKSGDEEVRMHEGELWWFNNHEMHESYNVGDGDRIHFIFDLRSRDGRLLSEHPVAEAETPPARPSRRS